MRTSPGARAHSHAYPVSFWILLGLAVAVFLAVNSISSYLSLARRVAVDQARKELSARADTLIRAIENGATAELPELGGKILWVQLRDRDGAVQTWAGQDRSPTFPMDFALARFRAGRPVFTTVDTPAGAAVVEAFPVRLAARRALVVDAADRGASATSGQVGVIEVAALIDRESAALWPLQRSLLFNASAAFVLMLVLTVIGFELCALP